MEAMEETTSFYDLSSRDGYGNEIFFEQFRGKVVLIVNVASLCGFSDQYTEFQYLHEKFSSEEFVILAFPCNQFGRQEPLEGIQLTEDIKTRFNITFPVMAKTKVNGHNAHPVYKFIKPFKSGYLGFQGVKWNFEKFLVNKRGDVVSRFKSSVNPLAMESLINNLINEK